MTKQANAGVKEEYLIPRFELFDLDMLIMPSFCLLFVEFRAMVGLLPPFILFSQLDLSLDSGCLEIHVPPLNSPMGLILEFNWQMASLAID